MVNVDVFQTVGKLCIGFFAVRANSKFQFVRAAVSAFTRTSEKACKC